MLLLLGGLANCGKSEAVLPAYLVGMALAPFFLGDRELQHRMRAIWLSHSSRRSTFSKAGSLIEANALSPVPGSSLPSSPMKMSTKFVGILPLTRYFNFEPREGMYTTLMMSTGLTFGSPSRHCSA